jgi:hypothetical protein
MFYWGIPSSLDEFVADTSSVSSRTIPPPVTSIRKHGTSCEVSSSFDSSVNVIVKFQLVDVASKSNFEVIGRN